MHTNRWLTVFCVLSTACSDYNLFKNGDSEAVDENPVLQVTPASLDAGLVCTHFPHVETVVLENTGNAPLLIDALETTGGWMLTSNPSPVTIEIGEQLSLSLRAGTDRGMLIIASNDAENPVQQIPLNGETDQPPTILINTPFEGQILDEALEFTALVTDDLDDPTNLIVEWSSDRDGVFATTTPEADGTVYVDWDTSHSTGYHTIRGTVEDSCENRAVQEVNVCQQMRYETETLDISTWHFEGTANWDSHNEWLELTTASTAIVGTAFSTAQQVSGGQVEIEFLFFIGGGTGADGISLTALDVDRMTTFLGGTGCGIGYGGDASCTTGPALPGWSIEVDTYYNDGQDPTSADHVMFTFDGDVDQPYVWAELPEMEDTGWHSMRVLVTEPHVLVEIDGVAYIDHDIPGYYGFDAYVGFTAGTGGQTNQHLIDSLVITEQLCGD